MAAKLRILGASNRTIQRVGYLKYLCAAAARKDTNNFPALGRELIEVATKLVRIEPPFSEDLRTYVQTRLKDRAYTNLRKLVFGDEEKPAFIELQDLYLADPRMRSSSGKLVQKDWRFYPYLATSLELIRQGTYSAMTRALVLLRLTSAEELAAFDKYDLTHNPLLLTDEQAALLLYCFIESDADVIRPLFGRVVDVSSAAFSERPAGDELPAILRAAISKAYRGALTHEDRERLGTLSKVADSVEAWRGRAYTGSGAREESIRPRLEPYCDLGLFWKPEKHRFSYVPTRALHALLEGWVNVDTTDKFLTEAFFGTLAQMHSVAGRLATTNEARSALFEASEALKGPLDYTPITDLALLAGIKLLFRYGRVLEIARANDVLTQWQREVPTAVRFTVDRMGNRAFVKLMQATARSKVS